MKTGAKTNNPAEQQHRGPSYDAGLQQPPGRPDKHDRRALAELKKQDPTERS